MYWYYWSGPQPHNHLNMLFFTNKDRSSVFKPQPHLFHVPSANGWMTNRKLSMAYGKIQFILFYKGTPQNTYKEKKQIN